MVTKRATFLTDAVVNMKQTSASVATAFFLYIFQIQYAGAALLPAPTNVLGHNTSATSLLVKWDPLPQTVSGYKVFYSKVNATTPTQSVKVGDADHQVMISQLKPYGLYQVRVAAFNASRNGSKSVAIFVRTDEAAPTKIPGVIHYEAVSSTSVTLKWEPLSEEDSNGILLGYHVYYLRKRDINEWESKYRKISVGPNVTTAVLTGLQPYTEYGIGAMGFNSKGVNFSSGTLAHIKWVITSEDVPWRPPSNLMASFVSSEKLMVQWQPILEDFANGIVRGYLIYLFQEGAMTQNITVSSSTFRTEFTLVDECRNYSVNASGFTSKGRGISTLVHVVSRCGPPVILTAPQTKLGQETKSVFLPCNYTGYPNVTLYWTIKGVTTIHPDSKTIEVLLGPDGQILARKVTEIATNGSLLLSYVEESDAGAYWCVAKNRFGNSTNNVTLEVTAGLVRVKFVLTLRNETYDQELEDLNSPKALRLTQAIKNEVTKLLKVSENFAVFEVNVLKFSSVSVKADIEILATYDDPRKEDDDISEEIVGSLVKKAETGRMGSLTVNAIVIQGDPPPPTGLKETEVGTSYAEISWNSPPFAQAYEIDTYSVQRKRVTEPEARYVTVHFVPSGTLNTKISGLEPDSSYEIMVLSNRPGYNSGESKPLEVMTTKDDSPVTLIVAIVIPLLILLCIGGALLYVHFRRKKRRPRPRMHRFEMEPPEMNNYSLPTRWWEIPRDAIQEGKEIGSGAFGVVKKGCVLKKDETIPCAIKMLKMFATEETFRDMIKELDVMSTVGRHPNVVSLIGACTQQDGPLWIVVSLAENGCLLNYLRKHKELELSMHEYQNMSAEQEGYMDMAADRVSNPKLSSKEKLSFGFGIAKGMRYLEEQRFVHRDLAARNILLGKDNIPMVSDFGLSRDIYESGAYEDTRGGKRPVRWMAPESLETYSYNNKTDVWAFGVTLWEIETLGCMPYPSMENSHEILVEIKKGYRMQKPGECSQDVYEIMLQCWSADPARRPTFENLVQTYEKLLTQCEDDAFNEGTAPYDEVTFLENLDTKFIEKPSKKAKGTGANNTDAGASSGGKKIASGFLRPRWSAQPSNGAEYDLNDNSRPKSCVS